jgi:Cu(I)/Ag(I) efflux system periplasmic protein CusF
MRLRLLAVTSIACLLFASGGYAAGDPSADNAAGTTSADSGQAMTSGVVKKVDKGAGKVTIRHGPIENLGMPQMTMIFRVRDPAMLDRLKEGDEIRFVADKVDGAYTVMQFEPVK